MKSTMNKACDNCHSQSLSLFLTQKNTASHRFKKLLPPHKHAKSCSTLLPTGITEVTHSNSKKLPRVKHIRVRRNYNMQKKIQFPYLIIGLLQCRKSKQIGNNRNCEFIPRIRRIFNRIVTKTYYFIVFYAQIIFPNTLCTIESSHSFLIVANLSIRGKKFEK